MSDDEATTTEDPDQEEESGVTAFDGASVSKREPDNNDESEETDEK